MRLGERTRVVDRRSIDALLEASERRIALLARCTPLELPGVVARLTDDWRRGRRHTPRLDYLPAVSLASVRETLETLACSLDGVGAWPSQYRARAEELALEAALVEALGQPSWARLAERRFPFAGGREVQQALAWERQWKQWDTEARGERLLRADDERAGESLVSCVRRHIGSERLPVRIEFTAALLSDAAAGDGVVYLRRDARLSPQKAERIALHEVLGHALPRERARRQGIGLLKVGTGDCTRGEEGWALWLEHRGGHLGPIRRAELARRQWAARARRGGADWSEVVGPLESWGATTEQAIQISLRAFRGGGLGRELAYLPGLAETTLAVEQRPQLAAWFERGRVGVRAAEMLDTAGAAPTELLLTSSP